MSRAAEPSNPGPGGDSATRALQIVGERWTVLILREAFFGVRRYSKFAENLNIPRPTLSDRLGKLVRFGLLTRERYGGGPIRGDYEYRLTEAGRGLFPVVVAMMEWGDRFIDADADADRCAGTDRLPAPVWRHNTCGDLTHPHLVCDQCGQPIETQNTRLASSPES